jgi:LytS/YehU family sensor histidine kinase
MKFFFRKYGLIVLALSIITVATVLVDTEAEIIAWAIISVGIIIMVYIAERIRNNRRVDRLREEKSRSEIGRLKNQLNPHFFFNTLNNLYSLSLTEPEKTPKMLLKLSDLMRYTIYKGKEDRITLDEELAYIKNYIALQEIRFKNEPKICLKTNIINGESRIPPLLFIVLVENTFKHGVEKIENESFVKIEIKETREQIVFSVENNFEPTEDVVEKGIGLNNLKRRLHLEYPGRHTLKITKVDKIFKAQILLEAK